MRVAVIRIAVVQPCGVDGAETVQRNCGKSVLQFFCEGIAETFPRLCVQRALGAKAFEKLAGNVIGVGGAPAVPAEEKFSALAERVGERVHGALNIVPARFERGNPGKQKFNLRVHIHRVRECGLFVDGVDFFGNVLVGRIRHVKSLVFGDCLIAFAGEFQRAGEFVDDVFFQIVHQTDFALGDGELIRREVEFPACDECAPEVEHRQMAVFRRALRKLEFANRAVDVAAFEEHEPEIVAVVVIVRILFDERPNRLQFVSFFGGAKLFEVVGVFLVPGIFGDDFFGGANAIFVIFRGERVLEFFERCVGFPVGRLARLLNRPDGGVEVAGDFVIAGKVAENLRVFGIRLRGFEQLRNFCGGGFGIGDNAGFLFEFERLFLVGNFAAVVAAVIPAFFIVILTETCRASSCKSPSPGNFFNAPFTAFSARSPSLSFM